MVVTSYLCAIKNADIYVWSYLDGEPIEVTNNGAGYLTRPDGGFYGKDDYHHRTILDNTIICNRQIDTKMVENTATFTKVLVGTIRLEVRVVS